MSGYSEANKIMMAKASYKENGKNNFLYDHCWEILKHQPKWILKKDELNAKKKKGHYDSRSNPNTIDLGDELGSSAKPDFPERPPGRKAQKEDEKKRKNKEVKSIRLEEIVTRLGEERKQLHDEKMAKIDMLAKIEEEKVKQKERLVTIAEKRLEQEEKEKIENIMMMDINSLDEVQQEYIKKRRLEIVQNMKIN